MGLENDVTYFYQVFAWNSCGSSPRAAEGNATPGALIGVPQNVCATAGNGKVILAWETVDPADEYQIHRSLDKKAGFERIGSVSGVDTFSDDGVTNGETYYYRVTAVGEAGGSEPSESVMASPLDSSGAPEDIRVESGDHKVRLSWKAVKGANGYNIWRRMSFEPELELVAEGCLDTRFEDTGLINGETYLYAVEVRSSVHGNQQSSLVEAKPVPGPPPPSGLHAESGPGRVRLTWGASSPDADYIVLRAESPAGPFERVAVVRNDCQYVDRKLKNMVEYHYVVRAANPRGTSGDSESATATPRNMFRRLFSKEQGD